jgi:hypothetical protein
MPSYAKGQKVNYKPVGGMIYPLVQLKGIHKLINTIIGAASNTSQSIGIIREVSTGDTNMTGRNVAASADEPRYEIENMNTHKRSAIKESNIEGPAE